MIIEKLYGTLVSRKFWGWGAATALLVLGMVNETHWFVITLAFIGIEGLQNYLGK